MSFTPEVYEQIREGAQRSAARIVPIIHKRLEPDYVVDIGCGEGWFAREFAKLGSGVAGVDESVPAETDGEVIDGVTFIRRTLPTGLPYVYNLAVCLEVAEHLPETDAAALVRSLCECAPMVLFSAAIPNQGGHGHLNEQWPAYWVKLFQNHGFAVTDWPRWHFWNDKLVEPWYRQNMLLAGSVEDLSSKLRKVEWHLQAPAVVHPDIYAWRVEERDRLHKILYAPEGGDGTVWNGP